MHANTSNTMHTDPLEQLFPWFDISRSAWFDNWIPVCRKVLIIGGSQRK